MLVINLVVRFKKSVVILFSLLTVISAIAFLFVDVNYNMQDYLPKDAESAIGLDIMEEEFASGVPNTRVLVGDVTVQEALVYKDKLAKIDGVSDVLWLDDVIDLRTPLEIADTEVVETYYKDDKALFSVTIAGQKEVEATDAIYELIGKENAVVGEAVNTATQQKMTGKETFFAAALLIPIIIIILVVSTNSWIEPVFFLTAIGVSVLINLGTNIFIGEVSFITQSVAPILQLAVSLDYAIFLLHSFQAHLDKQYVPQEAMKRAMKESFPVIISSALTTFFGFMALMFMRFEIGSDLGMNLVKGILLSFISVMIFLPALTLVFYRLVEKTAHKQIVPPFKHVGKALLKLRIPALILIFVFLVPSFLAQNSTSFLYGMGEQPETSRLGMDMQQIEATFGEATSIVLLVPNDEIGKEQEMIHVLENLDHVASVIGYANMVGSTIPQDFLEETVTEQFLSDNFSRIIINTDVREEGDVPFQLVESVREVAKEYYGDAALTLGESVVLYDMKETVTHDNKIVNTLTVATIGLVLLFTFRSLSIPIILLLTIQSSVWINLAIPYFSNTSLVFVGYLIVSTVQLAATVDYAILLTETYKHERKTLAALPAIKKTLDEKLFSIAVSASILSSVGFILWLTSSNPMVSSIGLLLGRGALFAFLLVITFLPAMLVLFDKVIEKTSLGLDFNRGNHDEEN